ncbi:hypothetical protein DXT68_11955 [Microbacterium foliorum]|uniref:Uncharacterized protein n=1 Tax=Microbacterium foliorum TaxID=104336 RepID=A0A0F0KVU6_9MICO|nr:hypothetical protein [Microbacterium foliorum]AXL12772.1 hypothetical protein DXT68_11955 [Microbacterium foliorum]KJL24205.1 hypothetical protein RN50_00785 [Microbacterium foliorum]
MSTVWTDDVVPSSEVLEGIAVLQRSAAHDAEVFSQVVAVAKSILKRNASISESKLIEQLTTEAEVNESLASSAVWRLSDEGALRQSSDIFELSFAR